MSASDRRRRALAPSDAEISITDAEELERLLKLLTRRLAAENDEGGDRQAALRRRAEELFRIRMGRKLHFAASMFGEPAWDVLLSLYIGEPAIDAMTVSRIAQLIDTPLTSALRWVDYLESQHLIVRHAHPTDRRSSMVELTGTGRAQLELYLSETLEIVA
jgi:DNA-binding MarR family transcriptional regulator